MNKKILLSLGAMLAMVAGVAGMAAYEAHVINVTAHIENALTTHGEPLHFGTVFPQEYLTMNFTVSLSDSFISSERLDLVDYKIVQKPKCQLNANYEGPLLPEYAPVGYATHECPENYTQMEDLCEFLSKLPLSPDGEEGLVSYYHEDSSDWCDSRPRTETPIIGVLGVNDTADEWMVDLKVPPVEGYIGQDWPSSCADWTVPVDGADYGCDLWVEVTNIGLPG